MGKMFKSPYSTDQADKFQKILNDEIKGEAGGKVAEVPDLARQFLEHTADPGEHPPV
jgi:hypothetical protein